MGFAHNDPKNPPARFARRIRNVNSTRFYNGLAHNDPRNFQKSLNDYVKGFSHVSNNVMHAEEFSVSCLLNYPDGLDDQS